jgi:hypothetical protein
MAEIPEISPAPKLSRRQAAGEWYLDRRFKDPEQRASQRHLHDDLTKSAARVQAYLAEDEVVRVQVLMELRRRSELNAAGNAAPALSALLGAVAVAATLFGTLLFAVFNGWFAAVVKMTDEKTGAIEGLTQQEFENTMRAVTILLVAMAVIVLGASAWAVLHARDKDHLRAVSLVWLEEYARASAQGAADTVRLPGVGGVSGLSNLLRNAASSIFRTARATVPTV